MALSGSLAWAAPQGGKVVAGQANISHNGKITNINQSSQRAAINWQKFGVKADETVNFKQPNAQSITLNRVIGNEKSVINGAMNANGKVFLVNPHGTIIGKNAKINVGGLVASTADISNDDFMKGNYRFKGKGLGEIENLGEITVPEGGVVALIAPIVKNKGKIKAEKASVLLASAQNFSITLPENEDFAYTIDKGTLEGLIDNGGAILADGGLVVLTAEGIDAVKKSVIRHSGLIQANTVLEKDGKILLLGDQSNSKLELTGTLKAEAPVFGNGGFIETSAGNVKIADTAKVSTKAKNGKTGEWLIDPADFTIAKTNGDMTGTAVSVALKDNNFTVFSSRGKNDNGNGNINVDDTITWNNNTLRLNADNSIYFNTTISATGNGKLDLRYGQATDDGGESDYHLAKDVRINLPEGQNFSTKKGSKGETISFDVIHKMPKITKDNDGNYTSKFTTNNIAFGRDIDLDYTKNYKEFQGWDFDDNNSNQGINVAGLGHHLNNLSLSVDNAVGDEWFTGLFKDINTSGEISNLHLEEVDIKSVNDYVGGIIGAFGGGSRDKTAIVNSSVSGNISSSGGIIGGLAGYMYNARIKNSYTKGSIVSDAGFVGGLAGKLVANILERQTDKTFIIEDSYSTADVIGNGIVGGLVGNLEDTNIARSYTLGEVSSRKSELSDGSYVGGLVGNSSGSVIITDSYAKGNVSGLGEEANSIGGLIGHSEGSIRINNSYATGNVLGKQEVGGLAGTLKWALGVGVSIENSFATGNVSGRSQLGGLAGYMIGDINNSYATGDITATNQFYNPRETRTGEIAYDITDSCAGGLVGSMGSSYHNTIQNSYATGNVSGSGDYIGGLVGFFDTFINTGVDTGVNTGVKNNDTVIGNVYATGNINVKSFPNFIEKHYKRENAVGGLIGLYNCTTIYGDCSPQKIENGYFSGKITTEIDYNDEYGGAIIGAIGKESKKPIIKNIYYNSDITSNFSDIPSIGLTTSQMKNKSSFKGFDFSNDWEIKTGQTPSLKNKTTDAWDFENVWEIKEGEKNPTLRPAKDTIMIINPVIDTGDDTGGDNTGGDNTGGDNTGGDNTGGDNTGGDNTGGDNTGGDNTGGDNTGGDNTGGDNTGGDNTGGDNTGGDNTGGDNTGGDNTGGDNTGGDNTGGDNTGGDNTDGDKTGKDKEEEKGKKDKDDLDNETNIKIDTEEVFTTENYLVSVVDIYSASNNQDKINFFRKTFDFVYDGISFPIDYEEYKYGIGASYEIPYSVPSDLVGTITKAQLDVISQATSALSKKLNNETLEYLINGGTQGKGEYFILTDFMEQASHKSDLITADDVSKSYSFLTDNNGNDLGSISMDTIINAAKSGTDISYLAKVMAVSSAYGTSKWISTGNLKVSGALDMASAFCDKLSAAIDLPGTISSYLQDTVQGVISAGLKDGIKKVVDTVWDYVESKDAHQTVMTNINSLESDLRSIKVDTSKDSQNLKDSMISKVNSSSLPDKAKKALVNAINEDTSTDNKTLIKNAFALTETMKMSVIEQKNNENNKLVKDFIEENTSGNFITGKGGNFEVMVYIAQSMILDKLSEQGVPMNALKGNKILTVDKNTLTLKETTIK